MSTAGTSDVVLTECTSETESGNVEKAHVIAEDQYSYSDGGWGWFIVLSSMVIHFIVGQVVRLPLTAGLNRAAGILYLRFTEQYSKPAYITAWVTSLSVSLTLGVGPFASILCQRFSYRKVVVASGIILAASMVMSGLSPNLYFLFVSYGIIGGIGKALAYGPGVVIVGLYFNKRRSLAVGLGTSGVALGAFAIPSIVEVSFSAYGYLGAFLIMTGISLQLAVCGFLLRPITLHHRIIDKATRLRCRAQMNQNGHSGNDLKPSHHTDSTADKMEQRMFNLSILKNIRFTALCIAIVFFNFNFQSAMIFLPALSDKVGIGNFESFPVVVVGICDGIGRIVFGYLFDCGIVKPIRSYVYNISLLILGIVTFVIPSVNTTVQLGLVCGIFGLFLGNGVSQQSVIIVDILGEQNLALGFGLLLFFQGIGTFIGPPISGLMKDINGSYDYVFYIGAVSGVAGAFVLLAGNIVHNRIEKNVYIVNKH